MPALILQSEADGPKIGDWAIAHDVMVWIEILAIVIISITVIAALVAGLLALRRSGPAEAAETVKRSIGVGLLIGLDLLIAADAIRSVTLEPTLENVAGLGLLVLVRIVLAWSIVIELEHQLPWRSRQKTSVPAVGDRDVEETGK